MCYIADMRTVTMRELRNETARLVDEIGRSGEEVVLTNHGRPVLRLVPIAPADWLEELMAQPPTDSGLLAYLESQREADLALDWETE